MAGEYVAESLKAITIAINKMAAAKAPISNIDSHLKSCSPQNDVYTYSFTKEEVDHINRALQRYDLVQEIKQVLEEQENK